MKIKLNINALVFALIVGTLIIPTFAFTTGDEFPSVIYPVLAILSGFIITGFTAGYFSKGMNNIEPGLAAIIISIACSLIIPALQLKAFSNMKQSDWLILFMNGLVFTYIGAWLSYKTQRAQFNEKSNKDTSSIKWSELLFSSLLAIIIAMILANLFVYLLGYNSSYNFVNFIVCLFITGIITGFYAYGKILIKAGITAILSITFCFDLLRVSFMTKEEINIKYLTAWIIFGYLLCLTGCYFGDKIQKSIKNKKMTDNA